LFVAVWPPAELLEAVAGLPRPEKNGLRWTTADQWHVTLRFMGEVADPAPVVAALDQVGVDDAVTATMGPAVARFDQRVLHVPVRGLDALAASVVAATSAIGRPPDTRPFHGHVTLARVRPRARVDLRPLCGAPVEGVWEVREVTLIASHLHPRGARYETVAARHLAT